jgi:hypothetical protein
VPPIPETQGFVSDVCTEFLKYSADQKVTDNTSTGPSPAPQQ